jgi:hypothetical protein
LPEQLLAATIPAPRTATRTRWIVLLWLVAVISIGGMAIAGPTGWDVVPYWSAVQSIGHGRSPYADGIVAVKAYYALASRTVGDRETYCYVYSPMTIPVLRIFAWFPGWLLGPLYWGAIAVAFLLQLRAGYLMASEKERRWLIFLLPFAAFFPGLLCDQTILSGNMAFILYGVILAAAIPGWKRERWLWFYLAVLAASICKAPMLTLLAFPVLVGRRQWLQACVTGAAGCLLFAVQPLLWPQLFREFLEALRIQFDLRHDFGVGPIGLFSKLLAAMQKPYSPATTIAYLAWAVALGALLLAISRRVHHNPHQREAWIPVAFVGTILMNPRIIFYDTAPLTIPMLLIAWRALLLGQKLLARWRTGRAAGARSLATAPTQMQTPRKGRENLAPVLVALSLFVACNLTDIFGTSWLPIEGAVLLGVFALGLWTLLRPAGSLPQQKPWPEMP